MRVLVHDLCLGLQRLQLVLQLPHRRFERLALLLHRRDRPHLCKLVVLELFNRLWRGRGSLELRDVLLGLGRLGKPVCRGQPLVLRSGEGGGVPCTSFLASSCCAWRAVCTCAMCDLIALTASTSCVFSCELTTAHHGSAYLVRRKHLERLLHHAARLFERDRVHFVAFVTVFFFFSLKISGRDMRINMSAFSILTLALALDGRRPRAANRRAIVPGDVVRGTPSYCTLVFDPYLSCKDDGQHPGDMAHRQPVCVGERL